jgi:hypothetical protein
MQCSTIGYMHGDKNCRLTRFLLLKFDLGGHWMRPYSRVLILVHHTSNFHFIPLSSPSNHNNSQFYLFWVVFIDLWPRRLGTSTSIRFPRVQWLGIWCFPRVNVLICQHFRDLPQLIQITTSGLPDFFCGSGFGQSTLSALALASLRNSHLSHLMAFLMCTHMA